MMIKHLYNQFIIVEQYLENILFRGRYVKQFKRAIKKTD